MVSGGFSRPGSGCQRVDLGAHGGDVGFVARVVQHVGDQVGRQAGFFFLEAAGGHGRGANAHAAGDHRLFRVVGDGVLVDGHVGAAQHGLGFLAGDALGAQVHQHHMALVPPLTMRRPRCGQRLGHDLGVFRTCCW
jgi:hypothetical protein